MKTLIFRFDIDTPKCIQEGVPNLLKLAKKHQVKFTFFVNVGQSVDKKIFIKEIFAKKKTSISSLSPLKKLGFKNFLYLSIFNPHIGEKYSRQIKEIIKSGHEVGLHGGKNHQTWFSGAQSWSKEKLIMELTWGMDLLKRFSKSSVVGFASPGWNGSRRLNNVLAELGFSYVSDIHANKPIEKIKEGSIFEVPVNILGEPGGVGYIEYCRARKLSNKEIINDFKAKLLRRKKLAIVYDHPCFAGVTELEIMEAMIIQGKTMGYKIVTIKDSLKI